MKRINNKGLTAIEVLISFTIAAIIIVGMMKILNNFETKEEFTSAKSTVSTYKNTVLKTIMNDIISCGGVNDTSEITEEKIETEDEEGFVIRTTLNFNGTCSDKIIEVKQLDEQASSSKKSYVKYGDETFYMPKVTNLSFNESKIMNQDDKFLIIYVGFNHSELGNQFDAINIVLPLSKTYINSY